MGRMASRPALMASTRSSSAISFASPSSMTRLTSKSRPRVPGVIFRPVRKMLKSLSFRASAPGLQTSCPALLPTRTPATGPLKGTSDITRAAEAPIMAATAGSLSVSKERTLATIWVSKL